MIRVGKQLTCGCCGKWFRTWEGYQDQDQDKGYGICERCQGWAESQNERQYDKLINQMRDALSPNNRVVFDEYDREMKIALVNMAIEDGLITWSVKSVDR